MKGIWKFDTTRMPLDLGVCLGPTSAACVMILAGVTRTHRTRRSGSGRWQSRESMESIRIRVRRYRGPSPIYFRYLYLLFLYCQERSGILGGRKAKVKTHRLIREHVGIHRSAGRR